MAGWRLLMNKLSSYLVFAVICMLIIALGGCNWADRKEAAPEPGTGTDAVISLPAVKEAESISEWKSEADAESEPAAEEGQTEAGEEDMDQEITKYVKGNSVNMREAPGLDSTVLLQLNDGAKVRLLQDEGIWSMVEYKGIVGYIHNDYLTDSSKLGDDETVPSSSATLPDRLSSPAIIVKKSLRILELWDGRDLIASYTIGLGWEPEGDKKREGDGRTPEGEYYICTRNDRSRFYLSLGLSYPNAEDAREALDNGTIDRETYEQIAEAIENKACPPWNTPLGGEIMIHGMGSHSDWTAGCIAVDNDVMDILWRYCPLRTPVTIEP